MVHLLKCLPNIIEPVEQNLCAIEQLNGIMVSVCKWLWRPGFNLGFNHTKGSKDTCLTLSIIGYESKVSGAILRKLCPRYTSVLQLLKKEPSSHPLLQLVNLLLIMHITRLVSLGWCNTVCWLWSLEAYSWWTTHFVKRLVFYFAWSCLLASMSSHMDDSFTLGS